MERVYDINLEREVPYDGLHCTEDDWELMAYRGLTPSIMQGFKNIYKYMEASFDLNGIVFNMVADYKNCNKYMDDISKIWIVKEFDKGSFMHDIKKMHRLWNKSKNLPDQRIKNKWMNKIIDIAYKSIKKYSSSDLNLVGDPDTIPYLNTPPVVIKEEC